MVDVNGQQCDGKMEAVCDIGSIANKLRAFGAEVREVDGHNVHEISGALAHTRENGPTFVLCNTDPCHGFPMLKERAPKLHYVRFKDSAEKQQWQNILNDMVVSPKNNYMRNTQREPHHEKELSYSVPSTPELATKARLEQSSLCNEIETVTRPHREHLLRWMKNHPKAIVMTSDLTSSCEADLVRDNLPSQYLSMGMAEQNMMSFAGGLAREGFRWVVESVFFRTLRHPAIICSLTINHLLRRPFIHTFGVFITRRPFDQVAMSIGVPNLPVRLLGFLPGLTTPGGGEYLC